MYSQFMMHGQKNIKLMYEYIHVRISEVATWKLFTVLLVWRQCAFRRVRKISNIDY